MNYATSGMFSGAASGAAAGSVAGPWGAAIGGVVGGVLGLFGGSATDKARISQNVELNKAVMEYNKKVMLSTADSISQINLQRSLESQRTATALFNIDAAKNSQTANVNMRAAVTDTVGASVRDAAQSVSTSAGRAESTTIRNQENMVEGYNLLTKKVTNEASWSLKGGVALGSDAGAWGQVGDAVGTGIGLAAGYAAKNYSVDVKPKEAPAAQGGADYDWWGTAGSKRDYDFSFTSNRKAANLGW